MGLPAPLTDAERTLYRLRLQKAEIAYDQLITGKAVRKTIDQNGESVEFTATNIKSLSGYIADLRAALDPCVAYRRKPRPIGFLF